MSSGGRDGGDTKTVEVEAEASRKSSAHHGRD